MNIPVDKIREVIGSGGKVIREIVEKTGAKVNIEDDGTVKIASSSSQGNRSGSRKWIHSIVAEPEVGEIYEGTVVKTADFGAFVNFFGPRRPRAHLPARVRSVAKTSDVVKEGDKVWVKLMGFDERGKVRLSMKVVDQATGKEVAKGEGEAAE